MPNLDKTGPDGKGPMTGRGLGLREKNSLTRKVLRRFAKRRFRNRRQAE